MEGKGNYDKAARQAEALFLQYDQDAIARAFGLTGDRAYLYVRFVGLWYRIDRRTGALERGAELREAAEWTRAGFEEVLSVYDALCFSPGPPRLTGQWQQTESLPPSATFVGRMDDRFRAQGERFARRFSQLGAACRRLGGTRTQGADLAYVIPVFDGFPVQFRFWLPDDEFPPQVQFFWDRCTLQFLHYETLYYIIGHLIRRLEDTLEHMPDTQGDLS